MADSGFTDFVVARQGALLRFAMVLTGDFRLSEEIVADVLARAFEKWPHIRGMEQPAAYVRRMIVNDFLSRHRQRKRAALGNDVAATIVEAPDHAATYAERDAIMSQLAALPCKQRTVIVLRYYEGLLDADIAQVMGCSQSTVRSNMARGLAALRLEISTPTDRIILTKEG